MCSAVKCLIVMCRFAYKDGIRLLALMRQRFGSRISSLVTSVGQNLPHCQSDTIQERHRYDIYSTMIVIAQRSSIPKNGTLTLDLHERIDRVGGKLTWLLHSLRRHLKPNEKASGTAEVKSLHFAGRSVSDAFFLDSHHCMWQSVEHQSRF